MVEAKSDIAIVGKRIASHGFMMRDSTANETVFERQEMLAGMSPTLGQGSYHFCSTANPEILADVAERSLSVFREDEGTALVLGYEDAARHGFDLTMPMARDRAGSLFRARWCWPDRGGRLRAGGSGHPV